MGIPPLDMSGYTRGDHRSQNQEPEMNEQKEHEATKKCAVYARLDRLEAHSVEEQIATCRAEIQKRGWILSETWRSARSDSTR